MLLLGMKKEILSSPDIWLCSQCHTCVAHCPQDVRLADIIRVLRQMAVKEGYASDEMAQAHDELEAELKKERIDKIKKLTEKNQDLAELAQKSKDLAESSQKNRDLTESTQNNKDLTGGQL
jgi:heterodisulfide reductase subunit C